MIKGQAVSGGVGIGPAALWQQAPAPASWRALAASEVSREVQRLQSAVRAAELELQQLRAESAARLGAGAAAIVDSQWPLLADPALVGEVIDRVRKQRMDAHSLLVQVGDELVASLSAVSDPALRQRTADVRDVTARLIRCLSNSGWTAQVPQQAVLVAHDLPPSELLRMPKGHLAGLVLAGGGAASHTAILARSMEIPAVMGLGRAAAAIPTGALLVVDGDAGEVTVDPDPVTLAMYQQRISTHKRTRADFDELRDLPAQTRDGHRLALTANIGGPAEALVAREAGAQGVGLFRTEFLFLGRAEPPGEAEQFRAYRAVVEQMAPHPVRIRTLDLGGDKRPPFLRIDPEDNPFPGWRGLRLWQAFPELLRTQLRALLHAGVYGRLQVIAPMVTTRAEVEWLRAELAAVQAELQVAGAPCPERIELGIMAETPAAALMAEALAPLVDFFSVGTNDLTQYTLAVDRLDARLAGLYDHLHPAVLRLIRAVVEGAHRHRRWVSICGELAGDPLASPLLLGLGLDELSMPAPQLAPVKRAIRQTDLATARRLAEQALSMSDGAEVRALLAQRK